MQIDNENYLRPHEAVALVRQIRACSTGWADGLVQRAIKSGSVRTHEGAVQNLRRRPGDPPALKITLVNKIDLLYWLDQEAPPAPSPAPPTSAHRASDTEIRRAVIRYRRTTANPTQDDAVRFAERSGISARDRVRREYNLQFNHPRRGRRRK